MAATTPETFQCSGCGRRYRWKPQFTGRAVKCACGTVMTIPQTPPPEEDDLYAFAPEPPSPTVPIAPPSTPSQAPPSAQPVPVLDYQAPAPRGRYDPDKIRNLYMPLVLLGASPLLLFVAVWLEWSREDLAGLATVTLLGGKIVVLTPLLALGMFIAARNRGFKLGSFWTVLLKLSALSVAPSAADAVLTGYFQYAPLLGAVIVSVLVFCLYFALIGVFFDLDQSDTWYCVMIVFVLRMSVVMFCKWKLGRW